MTLVLEIEYLTGVSFAALGPDSETPEWPPQPDRIYSALVATWAARGEDPVELSALEWFEQLPPPWIDASEADSRSVPIVYVPPNDARSGRAATASQVLPQSRRGQPRRFPATRPRDPLVELYWDDVTVDEQTLTALQRLARDVPYVGHSSSLTRCQFRIEPARVREKRRIYHPRRRIYPGRFAELRRAFESGRRPLPGDPIRDLATTPEERTNVFGERWLILDHVGGTMPDIRASAVVARSIRRAILSGYNRTGQGRGIPEAVSGHRANGTASREPHLAIVPLAFVGFPHADGHVMGFAVIPPHGSDILDDSGFRRALRSLAPIDEKRGRRVLKVLVKDQSAPDGGFALEFSPSFEAPPGRRSLDPALYTGKARTFATVTPIVLDRHLKAKGADRQVEIREQIAAACRNVGLPEPELISATKHPALEGVPSAYPLSGAPEWTRWRLPGSLASRPLIHAYLDFGEEVPGPVILGAGRFHGMGLCRPVTLERRRGPNAQR